MLIQFGHSRLYDYENELYTPIKNSSIYKNHEILLPHDETKPFIVSRETLKKADMFITEVSLSATGLGIELGFASMYGVKIVCFYKKGMTPSSSLNFICDDFFEYENTEEMITKIEERIVKHSK